MPPPELDVAKVRRYCQERIPARALHQVRLEVEVTANAVTIVERRAPWQPDHAGATGPRSRSPGSATTPPPLLDHLLEERNLRFHRYEPYAPTPSLGRVLDEITADPTALFRG